MIKIKRMWGVAEPKEIVLLPTTEKQKQNTSSLQWCLLLVFYFSASGLMAGCWNCRIQPMFKFHSWHECCRLREVVGITIILGQAPPGSVAVPQFTYIIIGGSGRNPAKHFRIFPADSTGFFFPFSSLFSLALNRNGLGPSYVALLLGFGVFHHFR